MGAALGTTEPGEGDVPHGDTARSLLREQTHVLLRALGREVSIAGSKLELLARHGTWTQEEDEV